jgi:hypothetical protein
MTDDVPVARLPLPRDTVWRAVSLDERTRLEAGPDRVRWIQQIRTESASKSLGIIRPDDLPGGAAGK